MSATHTEFGDVIGGLSGKIHSFFCGLGGHDLLLNVEPTRLSLRCSSCPYETPGWAVKPGARVKDPHATHVLVPHNVHG
jgi:hypothetical protein